MFPGVIYALLAGFLGAMASSSAKLSLGADYLKGVCESGLRTWGEQRKFRQADETTACDWVRRTASSAPAPMYPTDPTLIRTNRACVCVGVCDVTHRTIVTIVLFLFLPYMLDIILYSYLI